MLGSAIGLRVSLIRVAALLAFAATPALAFSSLNFAYARFQVNVEPHYVSSNTFLVTIEVTNVSGETFESGDVTISLSGDTYSLREGAVAGEIESHNAMSVRRLPPGTHVYSFASSNSVVSRDPILQFLKDDWAPGEVLKGHLKLTASEYPFECRVRAAGRLDRGEIVFEPLAGKMDQQGLHTETCSMERPPTQVDLDGDGVDEVIAEWNTGDYGSLHHYQVFTPGEAAYQRLGEFKLVGMYHSAIEICSEPDPAHAKRAILSIQFNSSAADYYVVRADGTAADQVNTAISDARVDMDGDGLDEWIFFHKFDEAGTHNRLGLRAKQMEVFGWDTETSRYRRQWPEADKNFAVVGGVVVDADNDGRKEIVALIDSGTGKEPARHLAVFKCRGGSMRRIGDSELKAEPPAVDIAAIRRLGDNVQIILQRGGTETGVYSALNYRSGELTAAWTREQVKVEFDPSFRNPPVFDAPLDGLVEYLELLEGQR